MAKNSTFARDDASSGNYTEQNWISELARCLSSAGGCSSANKTVNGFII